MCTNLFKVLTFNNIMNIIHERVLDESIISLFYSLQESYHRNCRANAVV